MCNYRQQAEEKKDAVFKDLFSLCSNLQIQQDQLRRYIEIKQSDLPSSVAAKKTREFRCPPREQMNAILGFKNLSDEELEETPCGEELRLKLMEYHDALMGKAKIPAGAEEEAEAEVSCCHMYGFKSYKQQMKLGWRILVR